jgi:prepilin-type N-terminal cleavage/methylation domain-containing protein
MRNRFGKLGFTLIELLIVITIIGILAVVFLPTILNAPAKSRDAARIASITKMMEVVEASRLDNVAMKDGGTIDTAKKCASTALLGVDDYFSDGNVPQDPQGANATAIDACDAGDFGFLSPDGTDKYALFARMEVEANQSVACPGDDAGTECYKISISK